MNCKPGELAIVVNGTPRENLGRIVRVTVLVPSVWSVPIWRYTDGALSDGWGSTASGVGDDCLRPIRDGDGTDEMIRIAGLPAELPADLIAAEVACSSL